MKTVNPLVSIITPLYNSEAFVERCLQSIQRQSFTDWEHYIIDDGSQDKGPEIAEQYAASDQRIRVIRSGANEGAGMARNRGIKAARGRYIAFLDSDDFWTPEKLEVQLRFMTEEKTVFSFTDYRKVDESGAFLGLTVQCPPVLTYRKQLKTNFVGCSTAMYDTRYFGKRYFPPIRKRQDFALWLELLSEGIKGRGINNPLTDYTVRKDGLSGNKVELLKHNWLLYRKTLGFGPVRSFWYLCWNVIIKLSGNR